MKYLFWCLIVMCSGCTTTYKMQFDPYPEFTPPGYLDYCKRSPYRPECGYKNQHTLDFLKHVQTTVNTAVKFSTDQQTYNVPEYWIVPTDTGDCEDFALKKLHMLLANGWDIKHLRLASAWIDYKNGLNHAVLIAELSGKLYILDNTTDHVSEVISSNYIWQSCQQHGGDKSWVPCRYLFSSYYSISQP